MSTKLEILQNYIKLNEYWKIKDSWLALGSNVITDTTAVFTEGVIYQLNCVNSPYSGCLLFCEKEIISKDLNWAAMEVLDAANGYISFGYNIISPNFRFLIAKDIVDNIIKHDPNFIPFKDDYGKNGKVIISEDDYKLCLKRLGVPFISEDELEYTREEILNLAIKPALEEYFHWLPNVTIDSYPVQGDSQEIQFPSDAYDVVSVQVVQAGSSGSGNITNTMLRYFDEAAYGSYNFSGMNGTYRGTYAPRTSLNGSTNYITSRQLAQANVNLNTRVHMDKFIKSDGTKWLRLSSNKMGTFLVHWAKQSLNFNDVEFSQRMNVINYCQAEVMQLFGDLRRQAKSDLAGTYDYDKWVTDAATIKENILKEWKTLVKASAAIRGSL